MDSRAVHTSPRPHGIRFVFLVAMCVALALSPLTWAKKRKASTPPADAGYIAALATANRFLAAWQSSDQEAGLPLITNRAKQRSTEEGIDRLFGDSSARAFEIAHGRALSQSRFLFPVVLLTGEPGHTRRRFANIVITNTDKNEWAVDKLP